jgi:hypothetical protein
MRGICKIFFAIFSMLSFGATALPQSQAISADLRGTVTDQNGAVVAGAIITVTSAERGIARTAKTDDRGEYQILLLPPGTYDVKVEAGGFATQLHKGITLTVGQRQVLDFELKVAGAAEQVVITTEAPLIEVERTQQANTIEERRIRDLPINRRNFLDFALLAPGVTDSDAIADNSDFRVTQTPQSGLSFYGSNGRGNSVTIDGAENNNGAGGVRSTISQEAVQEFQINRSNYTAEFGGASGGIVNIVSKTGTNEWRGSFFLFGRNEALDARNPFYFDPNTGRAIKPDFRRYQTGGTLGGPIRRDRTFFFFAYEHLRRNEQGVVPIIFDRSIFGLTPQQRALVSLLSGVPSFAPLAAGLQAALTATPQTVKTFEDNSGIFEFRERVHTPSFRIDHRRGERDSFFFRINYTSQQTQNASTRALVGVTRATNVDLDEGSAVLSWSHIFSPSSVNEFRAQFAHTNVLYSTRDPNGPEINIAGFGFFNRDIFLPSYTREQRYEIVENFSKTIGSHTIKLGGTFNPDKYFVDSRTFFSGRFSFGEAIPLFNLLPGGVTGPTFAALNNFLLSQGGAIGANQKGSTILVGGRLVPLADSQGRRLTFLSPTVQIPIADVLETPITALQAFNLGLPVFYQQGFGDPTYRQTIWNWAVYAQDSWKARSNLTINYGLRYELNPFYNTLNVDKNNFGPRVGFSWDPFGDKKMVVRGGYGIYYSPIYAQIGYVVRNLDGVVIRQTFVPLTGIPGNPSVTSATIYRTLLSQGVIGKRPILESDLAQFGIIPGPNAINSVKFVGDPKYVNSYTQQTSLGIERQLGNQMAISIDYIFVRGLKITRSREINYRPNSDPLLRARGVPEGGIGFNEFTGAVIGSTAVARIDPRFLQVNIYESSGNSFYHGMAVSFTKRYSNNFLLVANYTLSKAIDEVVDFNSDFQPTNQFCTRCERSLSSFDQRHRFVLTGVFDSPLQARGGAGALSYIFGDWTVAPIITAVSARPFNLLVGTDVNGDAHSNTDRPIVPGDQPAPLGRNMGRGPNFVELSLRLTRRIPLGERIRLEAILEGFNILNRVNFASVNNFVGPGYQGPFRPTGIKGLPVTQPLAFTSSFNARQIQFAAKLTF